MAITQLKKSKPVNKSTNPTESLDLLSKDPTFERMMYPESCVLNNPQSEKFRERVARTLLYWAMQEGSLEIIDFCFEYGIERTTLWDWCKKYPDLSRAYKNAMLKIAARRSVGNYKKEYSDSVFRNIHKYDPEWDGINQYHAALKNQDEEKNLTLVLNMHKPEITSSEDLLLEVNQTQEPQS